MEKISIAVGKEDFDTVRREGSWYVDKSELIYDLVTANNAITLFTRPRRFGKTLAMSMIASFFDIRKDSKQLFKGLRITQHKSFCEEWMNQYPVLFVTLKGIEGLTFEKSYNLLRGRLADLVKEMAYLSGSESVDPADKIMFERIRFGEAELIDVCKSLKLLTRMLHDHFGKPAILLIDEYDVPLAKASERHYYDQMLDVIRSMFDDGLKTNSYLKFAVVTGCLRIAKESVFTGTNNFKPYSILDAGFSSYFGFTREEVQTFLTAAGYPDQYEAVREWYDGYLFGDTKVFCPWDVVNYISDLMHRTDLAPSNYWENTSGNEVIRIFVKRSDFDVSDKFELLMNGGEITETVVDDLTYDTIGCSEENLWSLLLMTGYLTKSDAGQEGGTVSLRIPNREIEAIFEKKIVYVFEEQVTGRKEQTELMEALWDGDDARASELISDFLWETISYHNYHEDFYHAFLTGLFVGFPYSVKTDHEQGLGRTDLTIRDRKGRRAIIIEAKKAGSEAAMEKAAQEGKEQMIRKQYIRGLAGYRTILCYGISFYQKTALVKKLDLNDEGP